jgi:hydrogenase maturation protein HypF
VPISPSSPTAPASLAAPSAAEALPTWAAALRLHLHLRGAVQGVGFRPYCVQLAAELGLSGWVRNDAAGLQCEIQGPPAAVQAFTLRLRTAPPPLARIDALQQTPRPVLAGDRGFSILASQAGAALDTGLPADAAPCIHCLDELFDPADRRHRYAFINCTHCGPRFTITQRLPYDRPNTSLAGFPLCPACEREYRDPSDRRFHAQPVACPVCGPQLALWQPDGTAIDTVDPLSEAARRLAAGQILAVKGVGGYHLVCDATHPGPLQRLRAAKQRERKPFALLLPNVASARQWAQVDDDAARLLSSPAAPILLLPTRAGVAERHPLIAPGLNDWGLMLPAAPLHWLLIHELLGRPEGSAWREAAQPTLLVMTSANPGGEPLVVDEGEAVERLGGLCDALLVHNRPILGRVDDSVRRPMRAADGPFFAPFVRRARGHVPDPIELPGVPADAPPVLATGAWMKNTVCLTRGNQAFLSPHIGDLGSAACRHALVEAVQRLRDFLGVRPQLVAHDLHPDFFSSQHAQALAVQWNVPTLAVQHHHAHAAAVRAEQGIERPSLALLLDGVGLGDDGTPWGGELLRVDRMGFQRLGHLPTLALPGGDRAAAEPWRLGAALLHALGRGEQIATRFAGQAGAGQIARLLARGLNCPPTPSAGRLFDAAAALLGLCPVHRHEGEAAMRLEAVAGDLAAEPWPDAWQIDTDGRLTWPGLWTRLADAGAPTDNGDTAQVAAAFHATLVAALTDWVDHHARATGLAQVALGGGCFINRRLRNGLVTALTHRGLFPLEARQAPPGDGGIALGQAAIALDALRAERPPPAAL